MSEQNHKQILINGVQLVVLIATFVGIIGACIGAIIFIYKYWSDIGLAVMIVLGGLVLSYIVGYIAHNNERVKTYVQENMGIWIRG